MYIPLKYFAHKEYEQTIANISKKFNTYIYLPTIIKSNYQNLLLTKIENTVQNYKIKGFILSNISNFVYLDRFNTQEFEFIANYTFNIFNNNTMKELAKLGINKFTISPELDKHTIQQFIESTNQELICYGRTPLMNMNYCILGKSNKCYPTCKMQCKTQNTYTLKDRLNFNFPILPDNTQTVTTIYNSKITSINPQNYQGTFSIRIDTLEETPEQIQKIIETIKSGKRLEGPQYTNANQNRII